ncbi:MAG: quinone oxidoreductase [Acidobacteria bacterium]|nr:quinone oxidoreductase [Acidobacteriota bacterium]
MTMAFRIHEQGGPEVLRWEEVPLPPPGPGEVRMRNTAVGLNFIDVYHRSGHYKLALPSGIGQESAGVVEEVGPGVDGFKAGDRVATCGGGGLNAYAEARNYPADRLVAVPEGISDETAAAMMLKGLTAWYLLRRTRPVQAGETILVHAAAGGTGLLLCQWARHLGARVIGTVGSEAKAALAAEHGCHHPLILDPATLPARVKELTGGAGVPVVYDSVGRDTFMASLDCLSPLGMMVSFGQSSGSPPPLDVGVLAAKGSLFLTRPSLFAYVARRPDLLAGAKELFGVVAAGAVKVPVRQRYALADAPQAHRDLEARRTTGASVLIPG